jgi:hypothetical protein
MNVTYQCKDCGRWLTTRAGKIGATFACEDCGCANVIPNTPDMFDHEVDGRLGPSPSAPTTPPPIPPRPTGDDSRGNIWGGVLSVVGVVMIVAFKLAIRTPPRRPAPQPQIQIRQPFFRPAPMPQRGAPRPRAGAPKAALDVDSPHIA